MKHIKSTIKLTFFSTSLITAIVFILYLMLISEINADLARNGLDFEYRFIRPEVFALFSVTAILAYFISSIVIDRIFNPIRLMIAKVREIGNMNFSKPLSINSGDEELEEYAEAFNEMSQKLNDYIERQKRFISDASHELTTPITVINGHSDLLLRWGKEQPELLETELKIIKQEAERMGELVDSLLFLARSDSSRQNYTFERIALSDLINESIEEAKIIAPDFDFEVIIDENIKAKCDEYAIRRVMRIMLSNGIKYSGNNKSIQVKAYESGGLVNVLVRDYGIGIAPAHLPRIFDRFYRVDESRSKKTGSSGLGLAIAKEIITSHGGKIHVSSESGSGTEFGFIIPV